MRRWRTTLDVGDVFHNDALSIAEKSKTIAARIKVLSIGDDYLHDLADQLAEQDDPDQFDVVWDAIYDWADEHGLWVRTMQGATR